MNYEEQERSDRYDDNSIQNAPSSWTQQQAPYSGRHSTPMGARSSRRKSGCAVFILVLLLMAGAALGVVQLMQTISVDWERSGNGFSLAIGPKNAAVSEQKQLPPEQTDLPQTAQTPVTAEEVPEVEMPSEQTVLPAQEILLEVEQSPRSTETIISTDGNALSLQQIYQKMSPSVVSIVSAVRGGTATGTGIVMSDDGYIITNHHVIDGAQQIAVLTSDDLELQAQVVGSDAISDLAVLKVENAALTAAQFGDSDMLRVGDSVVAIGDPLGIQLRGTMTDGIISAINRDLTVEDRKMTLIQTNAALNNGNSGGPLINCYGQVIGINTMKMSSYYSGASAEGLGFAIPISVAKPIIDELIAHGYVSGRPAIGINGEPLPEYVRMYYRLPSGVFVTYVSQGSDAYEKGLREGDIITAVNGTQVRDLDEVNAIKNQFVAGDALTLTVYRSGNYYEVEIILMDQALQ